MQFDERDWTSIFLGEHTPAVDIWDGVVDDIAGYEPDDIAEEILAIEIEPYSELVLYGQGHVTDREAAAVLANTFHTCLDPVSDNQDLPAVTDIVRIIAEKSNFEVVEVVAVFNPALRRLHDCMKKTYNIHDDGKVYYGTTGDMSVLECKMGIRMTCNTYVALCGMGVHTSYTPWLAMSKATPDAAGRQTFLVVDILKGPEAVGREGQTDFGIVKGERVLTLTDQAKKEFCTFYEAQLYVTHRVVVRHNTEKVCTSKQQWLVGAYHRFIYNDMVKQMQGAIAMQVKEPIQSEQVKNIEKGVCHASNKILENTCFKDKLGRDYNVLKQCKNIHLGDRVKILSNCTLSMAVAVGHEGVICGVIRVAAGSMRKRTYYFVEVDNDNVKLEAQKCHRICARPLFKGTKEHYVRCELREIVVTSSVLTLNKERNAKRKQF